MEARKAIVWMLVTVALLSGCASKRISQFEQFSTAGGKYSDAIVVLTEEAGKAAIDADSHLLIKDKDKFTKADRRIEYVKRTKALKELLTEYRKFRKHSELLKHYFAILSRLATSDAPSGIAENTGKLVAELQSISPALKEATIGDASVKDFLTQAVQLSVATFQQQALERELKRNSAVIERELDLQHAFLSALAIELESDLTAIHKTREFVDVAKPYINGGKLSSSWVKNRRELISSVVIMGSVENAKQAAKQLKETFVALVENKMGPDDLEILFQDINAMLDVIELVSGTTDL